MFRIHNCIGFAGYIQFRAQVLNERTSYGVNFPLLTHTSSYLHYYGMLTLIITVAEY